MYKKLMLHLIQNFKKIDLWIFYMVLNFIFLFGVKFKFVFQSQLDGS